MAYELANEQLRKCMDWLEANKDAFQYMDLKLHDASYYAYDQAAEDFPLLAEEYNMDDLFYWFCEDEYDMFVEDLENNQGIDFKKMRNPLGRTSSFYLHDGSIIEFTGRYRDDYPWEYVLYNFINKYGYNDTVPDITPEGTIDENDPYLADCEANIDYIENDMYNDMLSVFGPVVEVYDYIKDFKDNQVDIFKEYLTYKQEDLEWEQEEAEKRAAERAEEDLINTVGDTLR